MEPVSLVTLITTVTATLAGLLWNREQAKKQELEKQQTLLQIRKLEAEILEREAGAALQAEREVVERMRLETEKAELQRRLEALRSGRLYLPSPEEAAKVLGRPHKGWSMG